MFNKCICENDLKSKIGSAYGYWEDKKIRFDNLPIYLCDSCDEVYLEKDGSILTQEMTIGILNSGKLIYNDDLYLDLQGIYDDLIAIKYEVAELIENNTLHFMQVDDRIIFNKKDIVSITTNYEDVLLAARSEDNELSDEIKKHIEEIVEDENNK